MLQTNLEHKYPPKIEDLMKEIDEELDREKKEKEEKK